MASLINVNGTENALKWAKTVRSNMARKPRGNDRDQARAVASGIADLAVINTYYLGLLENSSDKADREVAKKLKVFFPNQNDRGVHINISGLGVLRNAKNVDNANRFIEFLLSKKMQASMVNNSFEYPVLENVLPHPDIASSGLDFIEDEILVSDYGKFNSEALKLMDRAGWK